MLEHSSTQLQFPKLNAIGCDSKQQNV